MGGAGAFLSIPGLCMWDVPTTGAFLTALQVGGVWERIKVMEYKTGVDQVAAIGILRALHWSQHVLMLASIQSAIWISVTRVEHPPVDWPLVAMTSFAPAMLRGSCRHWPPETTKVSIVSMLSMGYLWSTDAVRLIKNRDSHPPTPSRLDFL